MTTPRLLVSPTDGPLHAGQTATISSPDRRPVLVTIRGPRPGQVLDLSVRADGTRWVVPERWDYATFEAEGLHGVFRHITSPR